MRTLLLAASGTLIGTGFALALTTRLPRTPITRQRDGADPARRAAPAATPRRLALVLAAALAVYAVTGWPVGALLGAAAAWYLPALLGPDRDHARKLTLIDAVAAFTEMLRDTLTASAGLNQALTVASQHPTRDLAGLLSSLATTAREQAAMRTRIAVARARTRTAVRIVTGTTLALSAVLLIADRHYLAPYGSAAGQTVLLITGALFGFGFSWLRKLGTIRTPERFWVMQSGGVAS